MAHFEIKDLTFSYASAKGRHSLENVSLTIGRGSFWCFAANLEAERVPFCDSLKPSLLPTASAPVKYASGVSAERSL